jgi:phytoene synthase
VTPEQYCQDKAAASASSFYYCFRFLPENRRLAITALYAFCREVDDVVDESVDAQQAQNQLDEWRRELERLYQGHPAHPVTLALAPHVAAFDLPRAALLEIIDGMEMDLNFARYERFSDLLLYCRRAAGVVGELAARIFGASEAATLKYADCLGVAFQLTNIIRDVGEDARRGRIYLPVEDLQRFDVPARDVLDGRITPEFAELMRFQIERAEDYYRQAWTLLPAIDRRAQRAGLMMAAIYRATLREILRDGPEKVLLQRLSLTALRKFWLAWKTWTLGYCP